VRSGRDVERGPDAAEQRAIHENLAAGDVADDGERVLSDHVQLQAVRLALTFHAVR